MNAIRRFLRWLFGSPFRDLPEGFEPEYPELKELKEQLEGEVPHTHEMPPSSAAGDDAAEDGGRDETEHVR